MTAAALALGCVHNHDLPMHEATGWERRDRPATIGAGTDRHIGRAAASVHLPGDHANHATVERYRVITGTPTPLRLPYRVVPGDHRCEHGDLAHHDAGCAEGHRPEVEVIAGHHRNCVDASPADGMPGGQVGLHENGRRW